MKTEKGFAHLILLLLLLVGLGVGIFLVQKTQIFKSKAGGGVGIFFEKLGGGLLPEKNGVAQSNSASVTVRIVSPLGPPKKIGIVSGPTVSSTEGIRFAENPSELANKPFDWYKAEPYTFDYTFKNSTPGRKYLFAEFKSNFGKTTQLSQPIDIVAGDSLSMGMTTYWTLDETSKDVRDNVMSLTGIGRGTKVVPGVRSNGRSFNGYTDRIIATIPQTGVLGGGPSSGPIPATGTDYSLSLWVKPESLNHQLLSYPYAKGKSGSGISLGLVGTWDGCGGGGNKILVYNGYDVVCSKATVSTGVWQHVAFTYQDGFVRMYLNGTEAGSGKIALNDDKNLPITIGGRADNEWSYRGSVDEVKTWSRVLAAEEVKQLSGAVVSPSAFPSPSIQPSFSPSAQPSPTPVTNLPKRVFVTSTYYDGNLGGLNGADAKCQVSANDAKLGGVWMAWLSDSKTSAAQRLNHNSGPYINSISLANNAFNVASNWNDLISGKFNNTISLNEKNSFASSYLVWTGTKTNGDAINATCNDWTSSSSSSSVSGYTGVSGRYDALWTQAQNSPCNGYFRLYCFEQ